MSYAEGTTVSVAKSRIEIETTLQRYGATKFASGYQNSGVEIYFEAHNRLVKFKVPIPDDAWSKAALKKKGRWYPRDSQVQKVREDEERRRWRCMLLAIKAKLEVVTTGIETFEQAFLANIVTEDRLTVYERLTLATSPIKMLAAVEAVSP